MHVKEVINQLNQIRESPNKGLPTGITELDRRISGLVPGELTIIGGFSGMGKTAFMVQLICNLLEKYKIDMWSLELSKEIFLTRLICNLGSLPFYPIIDNELNDKQLEKYNEVIEQISDCGLNLFKFPFTTTEGIEKQMHKSEPDIIFIDRLSYLNWPERNVADYKQKENICKDLQRLAEEYEIPVVLAAQMTMSSEEAHRNGGEMILSEFRGAKAIKDYSRCCLGVNRPGYYVNDPTDQRAFIEIMKKTNGMQGKVPCMYQGEFFRFVNKDGNDSEVELDNLLDELEDL